MYLLEAPPISNKVSTYTWGFRYVKANAVITIFPLLSSSFCSITMPSGFHEDLILRHPYVTRKSAAIVEIQISKPFTSERNNPIPKTPAAINKASEIEHTKHEIKT